MKKTKDKHDWQSVTKWKTWEHEWCSRCGTLRVKLDGTTVTFLRVPSNGRSCEGEAKA